MADDGADFREFARVLRNAGRQDLAKKLNKAITDSVKPLKRELAVSARRVLPSRGGLGKSVAKTKIGMRRKRNGVIVTTKNKYDLQKLDEGAIRHPVFPRGPKSGWEWSRQRVRPGWFSGPAEAAKADVTRAVEAALADIIRDIDEGR
jgi:hypothetical protein